MEVRARGDQFWKAATQAADLLLARMRSANPERWIGDCFPEDATMTVVFGTTLRPDGEVLGTVAGAMAHRLGDPLRLVHVAEDPRAPIVLGTDDEYILGSVRTDLQREEKRIESVTGATVHAHLAAGSTAEALASIGEWALATVLIVGAGVRPSKNPLGGVVERVARRSRVPVLMLRNPARFSSWLSGAQRLRVLVGADLGLAARAARAFAAHLGTIGDCDVEVMWVASPQEAHERLGLGPPVDPHALSAEAEEALMRELKRSAPREERSATLRVLPGRGTADAHLVARADRGGFDLVVVGQRRRSTLEQIWYGSVARGVLRAAPTSVACVPPSLGDERLPLESPRVVVLCTDLTETANCGIARALAIVASGGTVHLAHVVEPSLSAPESAAAELRDRAWRRLYGTIEEERPERQISLECHVLQGDPAIQLNALCERLGADLVILERRRSQPGTRVRLGPLARTLLETSRVPVLVVPVPDV
ncbi:MAG TPA: universal stress protein [Thermoanaerobaculia bacterium]|nr:universal stress protein [Thermoanaerobaculia bacterium]